MTIGHEHFLKLIQAEPDVPLHRLVYADWLEEQGDERAEFQRAIAEVMSYPEGKPRQRKMAVANHFGRVWKKSWDRHRGWLKKAMCITVSRRYPADGKPTWKWFVGNPGGRLGIEVDCTETHS